MYGGEFEMVIWLLVVFSLAMVRPVWAKADVSNVDSLLLRAMDDKVQYKDRKRAAKRATKLEWSPRTMDVMARVLMVGGKKTSAQEAEHWALRAIRREPDNPDYRATYAELLWIWDRREDSYTQAKRAIELDSNHARSLYCASRFLMWQIQFFMDGERERGRIHLNEFAEKDREEAIGYLERILQATPDNRQGRVLMAMVYYDGGLPGRLVALFKDYLERHPEDRDGHFFLGLGYQVKEELESAYRSYSRAVNLMDAGEKAFMQSMFLLSEKRNLEERKNLPGYSDIRKFWTGKDPLFLTPVNERLMEHCRRVAYSNLRFGDPRTHCPEWGSFTAVRHGYTIHSAFTSSMAESEICGDSGRCRFAVNGWVSQSSSTGFPISTETPTSGSDTTHPVRSHSSGSPMAAHEWKSTMRCLEARSITRPDHPAYAT